MPRDNFAAQPRKMSEEGVFVVLVIFGVGDEDFRAWFSPFRIICLSVHLSFGKNLPSPSLRFFYARFSKNFFDQHVVSKEKEVLTV